MSIAAALGADKDKPRFEAGPVTSYEARQTSDKVTIAAKPYTAEQDVKAAFGKLKPVQYGVLPILVVIQNDGGQTIDLKGMRVEYIAPNRDRIEATPPADVPYLAGPRRPDLTGGPLPGGIPRSSRKKNPLAGWEIEGRAFAARMLPPGQSASGFFYFQAAHRPGSTLYVTGLREAPSGKELFYFEIPLP